MPVFTPDDLTGGGGPAGGHVVLYDDHHYYMGSVLAELLTARGCDVEFVTPAAKVAEWARNTLEQGTIQRRLMEDGVALHLSKAPVRIGASEVVLACTWTEREITVPASAVVLVTSRTPNDALYREVMGRDWRSREIRSVKLIADAAAPAPIARATYAGRRYAEELDAPDRGDTLSFRREIAELLPHQPLTR